MATRNFALAPLHRQTALDFLVGNQHLEFAIDSFLTDRKSRNRSPRTIEYYRNDLKIFAEYCASRAAVQIQDIGPELLRAYMLLLAESHNPGGVHAVYRSLRALFRWIEREDLMPPDWKNPINKVDAPFVPEQIIEPVALEDVQALLATCRENNFFDKRDKAVLFFLLDTGVRAQELCNVNLDDVELNTGNVIIRQGKGRKPRYVFIDKTTIKAMRSYLRVRLEHQSPALFVSKTHERLTYDGLRELLQRRAKKAGLRKEPTLHDFRRAFALNMLRNGSEIYSLQRLMGHADLTILRRYLAQTTEDIQAAHAKCSPVEHYPWT